MAPSQLAWSQQTPASTFPSSQPIFSQQTPMSTLPSSQPISSQQQRTPLAPLSSNLTVSDGPYVLNFGKHRGKKLHEVPVECIRWLQKSDMIKDHEALAKAVEQWEQVFSQLPPGAAVPEEPYRIKFGKHVGKTLNEVPDDYVRWLMGSDLIKQDQAMAKAVKEWDQIPRVYRLGFGKHKGCTLDEVPPAYLLYLHETNATEGHDDLRKALAEHKSANARKQAEGNTTKRKPFYCPPDITSDYHRYYYNGDRKGGQMWIGCNDALRYFGADARAMKAQGLACFNRGQRFWLHQVFAFAKHFGTTNSETPTKALNRFKARKYNG